jgi:hypothetical protein
MLRNWRRRYLRLWVRIWIGLSIEWSQTSSRSWSLRIWLQSNSGKCWATLQLRNLSHKCFQIIEKGTMKVSETLHLKWIQDLYSTKAISSQLKSYMFHRTSLARICNCHIFAIKRELTQNQREINTATQSIGILAKWKTNRRESVLLDNLI